MTVQSISSYIINLDDQVLSWHEIELLPLEFLDCSDSLS